MNPNTPDILARIVVTKHEEVAAARAAKPLAAVRTEAEARAADLRGFEAALRAKIAAGQPAQSGHADFFLFFDVFADGGFNRREMSV